MPIMFNTTAQGARLIVDSSYFEAPPARNPFAPQVPQEVREPERRAPVQPVVIEKPEVVASQPVVAAPPPRVEEPVPNLMISGLVWDTDRPQAIINGQIVGIGDTVSGARIADIRKAGVTIVHYGKTVTIEFKH